MQRRPRIHLGLLSGHTSNIAAQTLRIAAAGGVRPQEMGSLQSARISVRLATVTRHTRELPSLLAPGRSDISKMSSLTAVSDGSERSEGAQDGPTRTLAGVAIARSYPRALTIGPPGVLT